MLGAQRIRSAVQLPFLTALNRSSSARASASAPPLAAPPRMCSLDASLLLPAAHDLPMQLSFSLHDPRVIFLQKFVFNILYAVYIILHAVKHGSSTSAPAAAAAAHPPQPPVAPSHAHVPPHRRRPPPIIMIKVGAVLLPQRHPLPPPVL